jgi:hypothetical protein
MDNFSVEVLLNIFEYLKFEDVIAIKQTCSYFQSIITDEPLEFWRRWKSHITVDDKPVTTNSCYFRHMLLGRAVGFCVRSQQGVSIEVDSYGYILVNLENWKCVETHKFTDAFRFVDWAKKNRLPFDISTYLLIVNKFEKPFL